MSSSIYQYDHKPPRKKAFAILAPIVAAAIVIAIGYWLINRDVQNNQSGSVTGETNIISQGVDNQLLDILIDEPSFRIKIPHDWKETERIDSANSYGIHWELFAENTAGRELTVFIDRIPSDKPVNKLLPVTVSGNKLVRGQLSDNCEKFTIGGDANTRSTVQQSPIVSKWGNVNFICNLPRILDNEVGTGSPEAINTVSVTGESGTHKYFFVYRDLNIQPKYEIFYNILDSFEAK